MIDRREWKPQNARHELVERIANAANLSALVRIGGELAKSSLEKHEREGLMWTLRERWNILARCQKGGSALSESDIWELLRSMIEVPPAVPQSN